jgi:hypothetical protein
MMHQRWYTKFREWAFSDAQSPEHVGSSEKAAKILSSDFWGFGIGAAFVAYFGADYFAFYPTLERAVFGGGSLLVIVMLHKGLSAQLAWKRTALIIPIILVLMVAFGTGLPEVVSVGKDVEAADKRCADIEREMLSARPRRSDLPDIFSALGCHVSGQQDIAYPSADKQQKNS